jgi:hypothetical protein
LRHKTIVDEISWHLATILGDVKRSQFQHSCFSLAQVTDSGHHQYLYYIIYMILWLIDVDQ